MATAAKTPTCNNSPMLTRHLSSRRIVGRTRHLNAAARRMSSARMRKRQVSGGGRGESGSRPNVSVGRMKCGDAKRG